MGLIQKRFIISALVYLISSIVISRLPLFNYLGYEFSAAMTFVAAIICPVMTFSVLSERIISLSPTFQKEYRSAIVQSVAGHFTLLLIPLTVITVNAAFIKNCAYFEGLSYYILLPCITVIFCSALAGWCRIIFNRFRLAYTLIVMVTLFYPLYIGFTTPQIYSYNFIYGFFPGFSYDQTLIISPTMILFRLVTFVGAVFFLFSACVVIRYSNVNGRFTEKTLSMRNILRPNLENMFVLASSLILMIAWFERNPLGFESSTGFIQQSLTSVYSTTHFTVHYSTNEFSREEIRRVAAEHEFRFHQVETALQTRYSGKIDSYIYPGAESKRRAIGTGTTNIAKPWRKEIHLNKDSWEETVKHEIVHVIAGEFGMPVLRIHYNTGLVEGLATAVDGDYGNRTLHQYAAAVKKFGLIREPEQLISPTGFLLQSPSLSYAVMGSFCRFLLDRYGTVRFKELYGGATVNAVYNKSYKQLVDEWQLFLGRINVPEEWREHVEFYFKRPSIFAKECARTVGKLNEEGWNALAGNSSVSAMDIFSRSLRTSWNSEAFGGLVRSAFQAGRYDTVMQLLKPQWEDSSRRAGIVNLLLYYGDALWYHNNIPSAEKMYEYLLSLDLSVRYNEAVSLRLAVLKDNNLQTRMCIFFVGAFNDSTGLSMLQTFQENSNNPILPYLKARIYFRLGYYEHAISELGNIRSQFNNVTLDAGKEQLLGNAYFRIKKFQQARAHFWQSLNYIPNEANALEVNDLLEKCAWYETNSRMLE